MIDFASPMPSPTPSPSSPSTPSRSFGPFHAAVTAAVEAGDTVRAQLLGTVVAHLVAQKMGGMPERQWQQNYDAFYEILMSDTM